MSRGVRASCARLRCAVELSASSTELSHGSLRESFGDRESLGKASIAGTLEPCTEKAIEKVALWIKLQSLAMESSLPMGA